MKVVATVKELKELLDAYRSAGKSVGLVPTMGALHAGHGQLIQRACSENEVCFVSVFVNPTQFNNAEDLIKYPRNLEKDTEYLTRLGVHFVFAPSAEEMYSQEEMQQAFAFDFAGLDEVMEGKMRQEKLEAWIKEKQKTTYVRINENWCDCEFQYPGWVKK